MWKIWGFVNVVLKVGFVLTVLSKVWNLKGGGGSALEKNCQKNCHTNYLKESKIFSSSDINDVITVKEELQAFSARAARGACCRPSRKAYMQCILVDVSTAGTSLQAGELRSNWIIYHFNWPYLQSTPIKRTNVSWKTESASCHLLNAVTSSHWGSIPPNECSPRQRIQVVVLRRVSGTLEHVQHPLGNQKTTCMPTEKKLDIFNSIVQLINSLSTVFVCLSVECLTSNVDGGNKGSSKSKTLRQGGGCKTSPHQHQTSNSRQTWQRGQTAHEIFRCNIRNNNDNSDIDSWPEMALVTDMRGECRAGVTPHTVWYPTIPAKPKVVTIWVKAALGEMMPRARQVDTPTEHSSVVVTVVVM